MTPDELEILHTRYMLACKTCNNKKPPRVHHCSQCERCILRMDHHCPWIANCVGMRNMKSFILFLMWSSCVTIYTIVAGIVTIIDTGFIFFEDKNMTPISINGVKGIGKSGVNQTNIYEEQNPEEVISIYRFGVYDSNIIRIGVLVW